MTYLNVKTGRSKPARFNGGRLTLKMRSFVDAYMGEAFGNVFKALELSMYKVDNPKTKNKLSVELMKHPAVIDEIAKRNAERTTKTEVRAEYLINKLTEIVEAEQNGNPGAALRAIELLGKSIALWKERQEISGPDGEAIKHEQRVKESVADFSSRISSLVERSGTSNVVKLPERSGAGGA